MFYLVEFHRTFFKMGIKGILFIFVSFLLSFSLHFRKDLHAMSEALSIRSYVKPYFTVFFDKDVNVDAIKNKVSSFPQVTQVQEVASKEGLGAWWSLIRDIGENPETQGLAYHGLRILMNQNIGKYDSNFVIDSVIKMAGGEDHLTTSEVKYPKEEKFLSLHPFFKTLSFFHEWTFIVPLAVLWFILYFLTQKKLLKVAFVMEHFQRKTLVASKILGAGILSILVLSFVLSMFGSYGVDFLGVIVSVVFFGTNWALTLRGSQWVNEA